MTFSFFSYKNGAKKGVGLIKSLRSILFACALIALGSTSVFAFEEGFILGMNVNFSGSATHPNISAADLDKMGAKSMQGGIGFIIDGGVDWGYLFGVKRWFNMSSAKVFSGMSLGLSLNIGQGFSSQVSGNEMATVFMNVAYTPVVYFNTNVKTYLFNGRFAFGVTLGMRIIADPTPTYSMYTDPQVVRDPGTHKPIEALQAGAGTIIVTKDMVKKMNPFGLIVGGDIEYIQPITKTSELVLGFYTTFTAYKPKYITMPGLLADLTKQMYDFDVEKHPLNSFWLNSFDFGIRIGINLLIDIEYPTRTANINKDTSDIEAAVSEKEEERKDVSTEGDPYVSR